MEDVPSILRSVARGAGEHGPETLTPESIRRTARRRTRWLHLGAGVPVAVLGAAVVLATVVVPSADRHRRPAPTIAATTPKRVEAVRPCAAVDLRAIGAGRQGEAGTAAGVVVLVNDGRAVCALGSAPSAITLIDRRGAAITTGYAEAKEVELPIGLAPGSRVDLALNWSNWCSADPGPLRIVIAWRTGGETEAPFDGPPGYGYVPRCDDPGRPSVIEFLGFQAVGS